MQAAASAKKLRPLLALPGLDVNARAADGRTPLMLAVETPQLGAIVADLLATGRADLEARDSGGRTAALLAARAGLAPVLRPLMDAGAGEPAGCGL